MINPARAGLIFDFLLGDSQGHLKSKIVNRQS